MAIEFNSGEDYLGYAGYINRNGVNNTFNVKNDIAADIKFQEIASGGDLFLDHTDPATIDLTTCVTIDGGGNFQSFSTIEFGWFFPQNGSGPFQYVVIDVAGQQYMFIHADGAAIAPMSTPFVTGNHNPLDDDPVCFVLGTTILTNWGEVPVELLNVGDAVLTRGDGTRTISWIGKRKMLTDANPRHIPIRISASALGNGLPKRDLLVSPQHRVLLNDWRAELMFGEFEVLVATKYLVNDRTIRIATDLNEFEYFHILFDTHQTIFSEGLPTESFHPGDMAMNSLSEASRAEVLELFPELAESTAGYGPAIHRSLKAFEARALQSI